MGTPAQRGYGSSAVRLAACLALAVPLIAIAQVSAPTNPPQTTPPENVGQIIGPPDYMVHARVPLTFLDIVVTDSKGNPIHGLEPSDFTILEDNQPMKPNSFEEHRTDLPRTALPSSALPSSALSRPSAPALIKRDLAPNTFTNFTATPSNGAPIAILLFDSLEPRTSHPASTTPYPTRPTAITPSPIPRRAATSPSIAAKTASTTGASSSSFSSTNPMAPC